MIDRASFSSRLAHRLAIVALFAIGVGIRPEVAFGAKESVKSASVAKPELKAKPSVSPKVASETKSVSASPAKGTKTKTEAEAEAEAVVAKQKAAKVKAEAEAAANAAKEKAAKSKAKAEAEAAALAAKEKAAKAKAEAEAAAAAKAEAEAKAAALRRRTEIAKRVAGLGPMSVGLPNAGYLVNGVSMQMSEDWVVTLPSHGYGTEETVKQLGQCITATRAAYPGGQRVMLGLLECARRWQTAPAQEPPHGPRRRRLLLSATGSGVG